MMYDLPDHPVIANMVRTGYPDGDAPEIYNCPACNVGLTYYAAVYVSQISSEALGCESCVSTKELAVPAECPVCGDMVSELYDCKGKPIGCKECVALREVEDVYGL